MEIVHGLNKERRIVLKELHTSEEKGAFLRYEGVDTVIEPELKVWERTYRPEDPPEGYKNAFYQITEECNKNCEYCYNQFLLQRHPGDTTLKQLIKSLDEFVPADPRPTVPYSEYTYDTFHPTVSFIGGEPTVAETLIPFVHYITNVMSNTGAVAVLLPIGFAIATDIPGISPLFSSMIIALSGGLAFVFIIATPGNAITYSSGYFSTKDLFKAGSIANIICIAIIFIISIVYWKGFLGL